MNNIFNNNIDYENLGATSSQRHLKVYILEDGRHFTTMAAAYFMGLVDLNRFNKDNDADDLDEYYEVTLRQLEALKNNGITVDYRSISKDEQLELKISSRPVIKIYTEDEDTFSIDIETAYSLELLDDRAYENSESKYYKLSDKLLGYLVSKYDIKKVNLSNSRSTGRR